jgi:hypothetical protein
VGLCLINFCSLNLSNWRSIRSGKVKDVENGGRTRAKNGIDGVEFSGYTTRSGFGLNKCGIGLRLRNFPMKLAPKIELVCKNTVVFWI